MQNPTCVASPWKTGQYNKQILTRIHFLYRTLCKMTIAKEIELKTPCQANNARANQTRVENKPV